MYRYDAQDVIRASPNLVADTVAVLVRDSLCFKATPCVFSYGRMIEFDYEIPGWAILAFADDSTWVRVSLAPSESVGPTGWVALGDSVKALHWSQILPSKRLFFLRPDDVAFHHAPLDTARIARDLLKYPNSERLDYIMSPLEVRGRWLRVILMTPNPMCKFPEPQVTRDTLWIQYLTSEHRPRVFFYTRGC